MLRGEAAKYGINGDEVINWMGQFTPKDYVDLFMAFRNEQNQNQPQTPVQQQVPQSSNASLVNWANGQSQYPPSIADLPGANVTTVLPSPLSPPLS